MNITFLIGNGFDIALGLETSYSNFVEATKKKENVPTCVLSFFEYMKEKAKTNPKWADIELAFGEYSEEFEGSNGKTYVECYENICLQLNDYLKNEAKRIEMLKNTDPLRSNMQKGIAQFYSYLNLEPQSLIKQVISSTNAVIQYCFIVFNYTPTLEKCLAILKELNPSVFHSYNNQRIIDVLTEPLHIHGQIDGQMIFGLNDVSQIKNQALFETHPETQAIVKPLANESYREARTSRTREKIDNSSIICVFGMSLGETDRMWWQYLLSWLSANSKRYLVLFMYDPSYNELLSTSHMAAETNVENRLFGYADLKKDVQEGLRKRIIIAFNRPLFGSKVIPKESQV